MQAELWKSRVVLELSVGSKSGAASYFYLRKLNNQVESSLEMHFITDRLKLGL